MDPLLLVPVSAAAVVGIAAFLWYRKRQVHQAGIRLQQVGPDLQSIESSLQSFVSTGDYIPERVRRPLEGKVAEVAERILPPIAKVVRRTRDISIRDQFEGNLRQANQLRQILNGHNQNYARRMMARYSKLLIEELKAEEAQQVAIVRDDVRNLVIA